jgi:hypothetical protein
MWCNLDQQPDPRAWLEDRLGPLLGFEPILDVAPKTMLQLWQHMQAVRAKQRSNVVSITATPKNRSHSCRAGGKAVCGNRFFRGVRGERGLGYTFN